MWIEELSNGKFKYFERYLDPLTEKQRKVSITLDRNTPQAKKAAQRELAEKIEEKLKSLPSGEKTIEDVYNEWIKKYAATVKASSLRNAQSVWRNADDRIVKNAKIKNVTSGIVQQWLNSIYYDEGLSYSTTGLYHALLSNIFRFARLNGYLETNPVSDVRIDKKVSDQTDKIEEKFLERDELKSVLDYLKTRNWTDRYADMMEFVSLTGLRYGELVALKVDDYDGKSVSVNKTIDFDAGRRDKMPETGPKNIYSIRTVGLSNRAIELINKIIEENELNKLSPDYKDEGYIFTTSKGTPVHIGNMNAALRATKKALGLKKHLSTHTFRHTHVSQMAEMNLPIKSIMKRVGHNSPNTTLSIYTHVTRKMESDVLSKLNEMENKK